MRQTTITITTPSLSLPPLFREALTDAGMPAIDEWWMHLDESSRRDALRLWHDCRQSGSVPAFRVEADFVDAMSDSNGEFWHSDFYEHLVNHEVYLRDPPPFYICTRHPVANAAVRRGVISHDFSCPFEAHDCPMRKLLALSPGKAVRLRVGLTE